MTDIQSFDFSINVLSALLWRHNNAVNLQALLQSKQDWYDEYHTAFWQDWVTDVFDLRTCNAFGLSVWAIILGQPLSYILPGDDINPPFGVGPDTITVPAGENGNQNFNYSNFATSLPQEFSFTEDEARLVLQLRYRQLTARPTVPQINKILKDILVPIYGPMYIRDNLNMTDVLVCPTGIPTFIATIVQQFDLIPRPAGVSRTLATS